MTTKPQLTLISFVLLFVCLTWVPSSVFSQSESAQVKAGHIVVGSGRLVARAADGTERRLRRRAAVYAGDTIVVGSNAFVQIRFTDGGLFSLRPDSEFKVSEYRHQEQKDENGKVVFELLKGGLRTISGSIGKKNRENYQLKTPVSTIGIRGTHYGVRLCAGDCIAPKGEVAPKGLYGGVAKGAIGVKNDTGEKIFGSEKFFHVAAKDAPIKSLLGPPGFVFAPTVSGPRSQGGKNESPPPADLPPEGGAVSSDNFPPPDDAMLVDAGTPLDSGVAIKSAPKTTLTDLTAGVVSTAASATAEAGSSTAGVGTTAPPPLPTFGSLGPGEGPAPLGSAAVIAAEHHMHGGEAHIAAQKGTPESELYIDPNNNVVRVVHNAAPDCYPCGLDKGTATLTDNTTFTMLQPGEQVFWGRWQGGWQGLDDTGIGTGMGSWHFMYSSNVTSMADLDMLQTNNVIATFYQWAWSSPGPIDGTRPTDELGNVGHFNAQTVMGVDFGTREITAYYVNVGFPAIGPSPARDFSGSLVAPELFSGPAVELPLNVYCTGCSGSTTGSGSAAVVFVGTNASHAINSFEMHTDDHAHTAVGTTLLTGDHEAGPPP